MSSTVDKGLLLRRKSSRNSLLEGRETPPRSPGLHRKSSNRALATSSPAPSPRQHGEAKHTTTSISREYFLRDLTAHTEHYKNSKLAVILHDSCYGHRYSRPRTSKASLSTIVERPERILAATLGVSAAYVLLGGRYAESTDPPHPDREPNSAPFIIRKSTRFVPLTSPAVTTVHGVDWMNELKVMCEDAETKLAANGMELVRPESRDSNKPKFHQGDLYLCAESQDALEGALGGVLDAVDLVFDSTGPNSAFVGIRPPGHHCSADYPSGFCWLNNVHVGLSHAAAVHGLTHAAIIDFDLHHGDGSQAITWAHNSRARALPKNAPFSKRTAIGYFSLHDINSYPCEWGDEDKVQAASLCIEDAHGQTIWNTHLQPWRTNAEFWELYEKRYVILVEKAKRFLQTHTERLLAMTNAPQPRGLIFISAGFDASEWEGQGMQRHKVNVPTDFYHRFTHDIMNISHEPGLAVDGRVVSVLEGGYSDRALTSGILSHLSGMAARVPATSNSSHSLADQIEGLSLTAKDSNQGIDARFWSPSALDELEAAANPAAAPAPRQPRGPINPTYSTPTHASSAKVHHSVAVRRSLSNTTDITPLQPSVDEIAPSIGWAIAAQELCKVIVPNRQTHSCQPDDLNAEATRIRRKRQSAVGAILEPIAHIDNTRGMQLRERKPRGAGEASPSKSNRRTTIEGSAIAELLATDATSRPTGALRRRVSVASTILSSTEENPEIPQPGLRRSRRSSSNTARESSVPKQASLASESRRESPASRNEPLSSRAGSPTKTRRRKIPPAKIAGASKQPDTTHDMDLLASGMKKMSIKLNLGPKPEPELETKKKAPRTPRKTPATPRTGKKTTGTSFNTTANSGSPSKSSRPLTSTRKVAAIESGRLKVEEPAAESITVTTTTSDTPLTSTIDSIPPNTQLDEPNKITADSTPRPSVVTMPHIAGMPPEGHEVATVLPSNNSIQPESSRQRLPVFTSTSPIPFATIQSLQTPSLSSGNDNEPPSHHVETIEKSFTPSISIKQQAPEDSQIANDGDEQPM